MFYTIWYFSSSYSFVIETSNIFVKMIESFQHDWEEWRRGLLHLGQYNQIFPPLKFGVMQKGGQILIWGVWQYVYKSRTGWVNRDGAIFWSSQYICIKFFQWLQENRSSPLWPCLWTFYESFCSQKWSRKKKAPVEDRKKSKSKSFKINDKGPYNNRWVEGEDFLSHPFKIFWSRLLTQIDSSIYDSHQIWPLQKHLLKGKLS